MLPKLTKITIAAAAVLGCVQPNVASANVAQASDVSLSRTGHSAGTAAALPQGCQRQEAYGTSGWWSAVQGCLADRYGRSTVKIEANCKYKSVLLYSVNACDVSGHYSVQKDGKALKEGRFVFRTDPFHGGGSDYYQAYACDGSGTYTLKLTDIHTVGSYKGQTRGVASVPDITVVAKGC
ncbi:hypothetical protein [Streptomyces sp. NPDC023838]|uniref:hypothetical protein n=1 Tax=Streptomyces sp. NPDC023838 TaxID=3154325 RepID=UPI0033E4849E